MGWAPAGGPAGDGGVASASGVDEGRGAEPEGLGVHWRPRPEQQPHRRHAPGGRGGGIRGIAMRSGGVRDMVEAWNKTEMKMNTSMRGRNSFLGGC